jgi:hypothetical protein
MVRLLSFGNTKPAIPVLKSLINPTGDNLRHGMPVSLKFAGNICISLTPTTGSNQLFAKKRTIGSKVPAQMSCFFIITKQQNKGRKFAGQTRLPILDIP